MTLKEIAVKQIDAMSEHLPMLCRVISAEELATISLNIMEEAYSKEELNLLTEWYKNPLMLQLVNKSGAVAAMAQQRISSLVRERIDAMPDEERNELFEDFAEFGNQ
jgi:DNA-directed RNA polymerase